MPTLLKLKSVNSLFALAAMVTVVLYIVATSAHVFSNEGFMPHGHCYLWTDSLVWTMVTTDTLIGLAYVSISICLYVLVRRIRLPFSTMFLAFGLFIAACGATHFMEVYTLWHANYWLAAFVKVITALASVATAAIMFPLFPRVIGFAAAARLSEERKVQLEILNAQLQLKTEQLTQANQELEAFSYSVSHDLRSPLRGIDGFSRALVEDHSAVLSDEAKQYLGFVRSGAQRMGQIIDDLLNLSRMTRLELRPQKINLSQMARETFASLGSRDPERKVDIVVKDGIFANGDPGLIRLVLENLLSNAWKFTGKTAHPKIEFGIKAGSENSPIYFVRDNGVGFDMTYSHKLFGAFQRLHSEEDYSGTGVGLATSKRIIDRHHGSIQAESSPGLGTTLYFSLGAP